MALAPFSTDAKSLTLEELTAFRRWSVFLPSEASSDAERTAVYVRSRQAGNPKFFEQTRERLAAALQDCGTRRGGGAEMFEGEELMEALHLILQAQWTAHGFHVNREFHKVLNLTRPCVELADALYLARPELLFWPVLCRASLGSAYVEFKKYDDARDVLYKAVDIIERQGELGAKEQVLFGACFAHLGRLEWAAGPAEEALRCAEMQVELFERFLPELVSGPDDEEVFATVMATAHSFRGLCEARHERYDKATECYQKAEECVGKHKSVNKDALAISRTAAERLQQAGDAAHLQGIRAEYAAKGGPIPV